MSASPADVWEAAERALEEGEERLRTADTLWAAGRRALAVTEAAAQLERAVTELRDLLDEQEASLRDFLTQVGLSQLEARGVEQTLAAAGALPAGDEEVGPIDGRLFAAAAEGHAALRRAVWAAARTEGERRRAGLLRALGRLGVAAAIVAGVVLGFRPSADPPVSATAYRVDGLDAWPPENAVDDDEMTYWQLPPGERGALVIAVDPPRPVRRIRILNGHDLHADDRNRKDRRRFGYAAKTIRVVTIRRGEPVAEKREVLPRLRDFDRVVVELDADDTPVDQVRVEIEDWYGNGGGLAEVEVLP